MRADQARHRIAGQADAARRAQPAEHQRLAGPHGDLPEVELHAEPGQRRHARGRGRRPRRRRASRSRRPRRPAPCSTSAEIASTRSGAMPRSSTRAPACLGDRRDAIGVGRDDLVRAGRAAGRQQFVAGGDDGDQRLSHHRQSSGGSPRPPAKALPHRARGLFRAAVWPSAKSSPTRAYVPAGRDRLEHLDGVAAELAAHSPG